MGRPKRSILAAADESLGVPDSLQPSQALVRVVRPQGNNLYMCELPSKESVVLELAQLFRNTIWIKRGGFVLAERYAAGAHGTQAAGEIVNIVRDVKLWMKQSYWPKEFAKNAQNACDDEDDSNVGKMPPIDSDQ